MPFSIKTNSSSVKTPFIFFGELTSGLFHLSSDLAHALGVSEEGPCHLGDVIYPRIINDSDRENLRVNIESLALGQQTTMLQHVRLRIEGICVWTAIRARAYTSEAGGNVLLSGSFEFFSFRHILSELLEHSDFTAKEVDVLKTLAGAPREYGLGFIRLESESVRDALLPDMMRLIMAALANDVPQIITAYLFDPVTILFTCQQPTLDFEHTVARLVEDILRDHHTDSIVKEVLHISRGAPDLVQSVRLRMDFWKELAKIFTNSLGPTKFSFREIMLTAQACLDDFSGFKLLIQPLVKKDSLEFSGGEFLIRFASDQGFGPDRFIALLEKSALAVPFSRFVFDRAVSLAASVRAQLPENFRFHINLSPKQSEDDELFGFIDTILTLRHVPHDSIVIELTETGERTNQAAIARFAGLCRHRGIGIAVDDFGTGYNSLDFVLSIPCSMVKFSREITLTCLSDRKRLTFLTRLIECFKGLDLSISLEGIQDETVFRAVAGIDADNLQGYYFGKPIEIEVFAQTAGETTHKACVTREPKGESS